MEKNDQNYCRRCGTCCEKGGPTLHLEDRPLVESGHIPLMDLMTLRKGEMVYDHIQKRAMPAPEELVKVQGDGKTWCCRYYQAQGKTCGIYADRPLECRVMTCWDTADIEALYHRDRLSREAMLSGVAGLWDLVCEHQRRCDYQRLAQLTAGGVSEMAADAMEAVSQMVNYDLHLRNVLGVKGGMDERMLPFLLGRPMTETAHGFGLAAEIDGQRVILKPA